MTMKVIKRHDEPKQRIMGIKKLSEMKAGEVCQIVSGPRSGEYCRRNLMHAPFYVETLGGHPLYWFSLNSSSCLTAAPDVRPLFPDEPIVIELSND